jgi:transposase InsO family protein
MSVVSKWIKQFGRDDLLNTVIRVKMRSEDDRLKQLEAENRRLKIALAEATLAKDVLESLIEVVDEHYQTDVKKKLWTRAVSRCSTTKGQKVTDMCSYFDYSRSAYYKRLRVDEQEVLSSSLILEMVRRERCLQPRLGVRKLYWMLCSDIHRIAPHFGRDKFFSLLRAHDLLVSRKRQSCRTTHSYHHFHRYGNLIKELSIEFPNQVWASDITYLRTENGFVYLSLLTDMYSRKIVGWSVSASLSIEGCVAALQKALGEHPVHNSLIHHSDRGVQYCSHIYVNLLKKRSIDISMTEENHCYENALAERVNGILKDEYLLDRTFKCLSDAQKACREAVMLYNTRRPHWSLNLKTPEEVHHAA